MGHKNTRRRGLLALCSAALGMALLLGVGPLSALAADTGEMYEAGAEGTQAAGAETYEDTAPLPEDGHGAEESAGGNYVPPEEEANLPPDTAPEPEDWDPEEPENETEDGMEGVWDVYSAADFRLALAGASDGDTLLLHNSLVMGEYAPEDGDPSVPVLAGRTGMALTIAADEGGPYTIYRADAGRHLVLDGVTQSTIQFENIILATENTADGQPYGGGLLLQSCEEIAITGAQIYAAGAEAGAALLQLNSRDILLADSTLEGNTAAYGGAIYLDEGSSLRLEGTVLRGNTAVEGGAVYLHGYEALTADNGTLFAGNTAEEGYALEDDALIELHETLIQACGFTEPYTYAYNNHDISYTLDEAAPVEGEKPQPHEGVSGSRRLQREAETNAEMGYGYGYWIETGNVPGAGLGVLFGTANLFPLEEEPVEGEWSLLNLVLGMLGFAASVLTVIGLLASREPNRPRSLRAIWQRDRLGFAWGIVGAVTGLFLLLLLVATQDMALPMVLADSYTLLFSTGFALQLTCVALLRLGAAQVGSPGRYWAGALRDFTWE